MAKANHEFDDDIFTLKEDEGQKRRAHILQYALISIFAVCVLSIALYMSFWLTNNRIEYQSKIVVEQPSNPEESLPPEQNPDYWPGDLFPQVPKIEAAVYDTRVDPERAARAEVNVPMSVAAGFEDYADKLADDGGQVFIKTQRMTIVSYNDIEIHLLYGSTKNAIVLCGEPGISFADPAYSAFPMPQAGKLVEVLEGTGEGSRVLTYRLASCADALSYSAQLVSNGWTMSGSLEPEDQIFACSFKKEGEEGKPGMQISIDYFSGSDNYRVRFDFIQAPTPAPGP